MADEQKILAFEHLRNVLYILADLHEGVRCTALDRALEFYNDAKPTERIRPTGAGIHRLVHDFEVIPERRVATQDY